MKKRLYFAAALTALLVAAPGMAQTAAPETGPEDVRVNQLIVYGDDKCPPSTDEEITVCARLGESDRYRIPPNLRDDPNDRAGQSWASRASELQYVGASGIGSCSTAGPGGFTGCLNQIINNARAERRQRDEVNWNRLIEEARQERRARLEAQADAEAREPPQ